MCVELLSFSLRSFLSFSLSLSLQGLPNICQSFLPILFLTVPSIFITKRNLFFQNRNYSAGRDVVRVFLDFVFKIFEQFSPILAEIDLSVRICSVNHTIFLVPQKFYGRIYMTNRLEIRIFFLQKLLFVRFFQK